MNNELYKMRRELERLRIDCQTFLESSQKEAERLSQIRPAATPPPSPIPTPNPAAESKQKQWRFTTGENGQIPPEIALQAATDANLLAAISSEIEERSGHER